MIDFIWKGLLDLQVERELQNETLLPTVGYEPGIFRLRCGRAKLCTTKSEIHWAC